MHAATLSAAAGILATEAYHAGAVRALLAALAEEGADTPFGPVADVVQLISDLRDAVDGATDLDQGIVADGDVNVVPTDENGLVFSRTVAETLAVVYLGNAERGGFFPRGVTGFFGPQACTAPPTRAPQAARPARHAVDSDAPLHSHCGQSTRPRIPWPCSLEQEHSPYPLRWQ